MVHKTTMNMLNVSSVSAIRVLLLVSAARCIGMSFTVRIHGTGTYIPMVCMLMHSRHSVIRSGGIGVMALTAGDGTMAGDGIVLITLGDILRVIGAAGMAATGVAGMAAVIGDITTTGTVVLAGAGAEVEAVIGQALPIRIVVLPDKAVTEIRLVNMVRVLFVPVVLQFVEVLQFVLKVVLFVLQVLLIAEELLPGV